MSAPDRALMRTCSPATIVSARTPSHLTSNAHASPRGISPVVAIIGRNCTPAPSRRPANANDPAHGTARRVDERWNCEELATLGGGLPGRCLLRDRLLRRSLARRLAGEHGVLEGLERRHFRLPLRGDLDRLAGGGVAPHARGAIDAPELREARDGHVLTSAHRLGDDVDEG